MKMKFTLGSTFDILSGEEFRDGLKELRSWQAEMVRGIRFRTPHTRGIQAGAVWSVATDGTPPDKDTLGPEQGFVWRILNVAVSGAAIAAADTFSVWTMSQSPTSFIGGPFPKFWTPQAPIILAGGEYLTLAGAATAGAGDVWVALRIAEAPVELGWRLLT
jgi:hypothetical protein